MISIYYNSNGCLYLFQLLNLYEYLYMHFSKKCKTHRDFTNFSPGAYDIIHIIGWILFLYAYSIRISLNIILRLFYFIKYKEVNKDF